MKIEVTKVRVLDDTDYKILDKLAAGRSHKMIAADLYLKKDHVTYRVKELKKHFNCDTTVQLVKLFYETTQE